MPLYAPFNQVFNSTVFAQRMNQIYPAALAAHPLANEKKPQKQPDDESDIDYFIQHLFDEPMVVFD